MKRRAIATSVLLVLSLLIGMIPTGAVADTCQRLVVFKSFSYKNADFCAGDYTYADFSRSNFTNANLRGADFTNAKLEGVNFTNADLRGVIFGGRLFNINGAELKGVNLAGTPMDFNLRGIKLSSANLTSVDLTGKEVDAANLSYANLTSANLSNANLSKANLSYANLTSADLSNANLTGANLNGAILNGANISGAKLSSATLKLARGESLTGQPIGLINWYEIRESRLVRIVHSGSVAINRVSRLVGTHIEDTLQARVSGIWDAGSTFSFQWYRDQSPIPGARSSTYLVSLSDCNHKISVLAISATDDGSGASARAENTGVEICDLPSANLKIIGVPKVQRALTVSVSASVKGVKLSYQWYLDSKKIKGATRSQLVVLPSYLHRTVFVTVTQSATGFNSTTSTSARIKIK